MAGSAKTFSSALRPNDFVRALQNAGLLPESNYIRSVVIYCEPHDFVRIEVSMEADERIYDIIPELERELPNVA